MTRTLPPEIPPGSRWKYSAPNKRFHGKRFTVRGITKWGCVVVLYDGRTTPVYVGRPDSKFFARYTRLSEEEMAEEEKVSIYRVKFSPNEDTYEPYWKNVGTVVVDHAAGRGSLYLNWLPHRYQLFLKEERVKRVRQPKAAEEEQIIICDSKVVSEEESPFKKNWLALRSITKPWEWYVFSFNHLGGTWEAYEITVEQLERK